ncbi:MAG: efflux RND transporter periplasmic adaptor subunit [Candidatus Pacebacteria bacterium]|nr:efflux RND transporter periplasmic adaptor subunit [Candidatus Paceibacterota bacterium]
MLKNIPKNILKFVKKRKTTSVIIAILLVVAGYFGISALRGNTAQTRYALAAVEKGTLITSVSGSGQISALNQVDIKPQVSGQIVAVYATLGQEVTAGTLLAQIDTQDAARALRDAETNLETAKLELDNLLEPVDELTLFQAENALTQAGETRQKADDNLQKAYEDGFNTVSNAFLDLPTVMAGLSDILFGNAFNKSQANMDYYVDNVKAFDTKALQYGNIAYDNYQKARTAYDKNFNDYKSASRFSSTSTIEDLINESYETAKKIAEAVKSANDLIQFYQDKLTERNLKPNSLSNTHLSSLNAYTGTTNSNFSSLLSAQKSIEDSKVAITDAERSIQEKTLSLAKTKAGADDLSIRAKKITIQQKEDALLTAQEALADCYIRAPFGGVIVKVSAKKGDTASSGTSLVTLATQQKIAEISLNEVDIAKVKKGQKATLTFDAVDGLSITGEVAEIDSLGTVSQGVVTYTVKIVFDTQDDRVKPGMSVSASIITDAKSDVLLVPNSAVKTSGDRSYVEMLDEAVPSNQSGANTTGVISQKTPKQQSVTVGSFNDSLTEIVSGLKEGDQVITQTITAATSQSQSQQNSGLGIQGLGGGGFGR